MKKLFILVGLVCLIAMLLPACAPAPEPEPEPAPEPVFDQAAEEVAIREWLEKREAAFNQRNVKVLGAQLDETYENWEGTLKGRAAFEKNRMEWLENAKDVQIAFLDEIGIVFLTPDVAIYKGYAELTNTVDEDGKEVPTYKFLSGRVLVKKDGQWFYAASFTRPIEE